MKIFDLTFNEPYQQIDLVNYSKNKNSIVILLVKKNLLFTKNLIKYALHFRINKLLFFCINQISIILSRKALFKETDLVGHPVIKIVQILNIYQNNILIFFLS